MTSASLFQTPAWFEVLNLGFGTSSHRINDTLAVTVFRIGPLGLAYANFPVGIRTLRALDTVMQPEIHRAIKAVGGDLLRFSVPESLARQKTVGVLRLPETCIHNLVDWTEQGLASDVRYKIRRTRRENIQIRPARGSDAPFIYKLYRATVKRHEGRLRYSPAYFSVICKLAETMQQVSGLIAETPDHIPCGFIITVQNSECTYYLHGGFDSASANMRPGYALMFEAIKQARENGCTSFNFMASPVNQHSLIDFKEKWGGETYDLFNYDIPISKIGHLVQFGMYLRRRIFFQRWI